MATIHKDRGLINSTAWLSEIECSAESNMVHARNHDVLVNSTTATNNFVLRSFVAFTADRRASVENQPGWSFACRDLLVAV
jgi:hypothetical protein